jgi:exodeoxyribonuclease-3
MAWFQRLIAHAQTLQESKLPVVLAGDFNVVPTDADIYKPDSWRDNALLQPAPRRAYAELLSQGWLDCLRHKHPRDPMFTFWDYRRNRWTRDAGLRIDHVLLSNPLHRKLKSAGVDRAVRGVEGASDHAPVWIELRD